MSTAITALIRTILPLATAAVQSGKSLATVRRVFETRYRDLIQREPKAETWERLERHARVIAVLSSSPRKALAEEYEQLAGEPPPMLTVEDLEAEVLRLRALTPSADRPAPAVPAPVVEAPRELPQGWRLVQVDHLGAPSPYGDYWQAFSERGEHTDPMIEPASACFWARRLDPDAPLVPAGLPRTSPAREAPQEGAQPPRVVGGFTADECDAWLAANGGGAGAAPPAGEIDGCHHWRAPDGRRTGSYVSIEAAQRAAERGELYTEAEYAARTQVVHTPPVRWVAAPPSDLDIAELCRLQAWQAARTAAGNDHQAQTFVEQQKAAAVAELRAAWRAGR